MSRANVTFKLNDDAAYETLMKALAKSPAEMVRVARDLPSVEVKDLPDNGDPRDE